MVTKCFFSSCFVCFTISKRYFSFFRLKKVARLLEFEDVEEEEKTESGDDDDDDDDDVLILIL